MILYPYYIAIRHKHTIPLLWNDFELEFPLKVCGGCQSALLLIIFQKFKSRERAGRSKILPLATWRNFRVNPQYGICVILLKKDVDDHLDKAVKRFLGHHYHNAHLSFCL